MKKRLTRGEKWLFASPLLFLLIAGVAWLRQSLGAASGSIELPANYSVASNLMEYSPDGRRLLVFRADSKSRRLYGLIYDVKSRTEFRVLERPIDLTLGDSLLNAAWSVDGKQILLNSMHRSLPIEAREISVWDVYSGALKVHHHYLPKEAEWMVGDTRFAPDGKTLIGGGIPMARYDAMTGKRLNQPDKSLVQIPFFHAANTRLGLLAKRIWKDDGDITKDRFRLLDLKTRKVVWNPPLKELREFWWYNDILCVSENIEKRTVTDSINIKNENHLWLWDGKTRQPLPSPPVFDGADMLSLRFNSDGRSLAYFHGKYTRNWQGRGYIGALTVWDYRAHRVLWRYESSSPLTDLQWSPNGQFLSAETIEGADSKILVFNKTGELGLESARATVSAHWSPDSQQLATLSGQTEKNKAYIYNRIDLYDLS